MKWRRSWPSRPRGGSRGAGGRGAGGWRAAAGRGRGPGRAGGAVGRGAGGRVFDAQGGGEWRLAGAAGVEAPAEQPGEPVQITLGDPRLVFAGTGLHPEAVLSALASGMRAGPVNGAFMSFWL